MTRPHAPHVDTLARALPWATLASLLVAVAGVVFRAVLESESADPGGGDA